MDEQEKIDLLKLFHENPELAHKYLFPSRRENISAPCHGEMIDFMHSASALTCLEAFRGAAKTTLAEETIILEALFSEHNYILALGSTYTNACKMLSSIKTELMMNERIGELFGWQESTPWTADTLVLKNGVRIEALGVGQAMRGVKFNEHRPSLAVGDDLEDEESAATKLAREKIAQWFWGVLFPALHPTRRKIKLIGTPIHPECLIEELFKDKQWACKRFPLIVIDEKTGEEVSAWPDRFPMSVIQETRDMMYRQGRASQFAREYLCAAEDEDTKPFKRHMLKVHPAVTRYRPRYIVCDPARTTNTKTSARTGYVVAAWEGTKLIVEDALGAFHMPNEIIETLFEWNKKYEPITVGVESNALDEFLRQPIRNEMLARHVSIPFQDLRAPHDKDAFIRGLQPFYNAGLVVHTKPLPDLENELLAYPSGRRDVVNALAYLLTLRPGNPVYSDFTEKNIQIGLKIRDDKMRFLIVSGRPALTVAAIVQLIEGVAYVIWDSIYHAPVSETFEYLYQDAIQIAGEVRLVIPREEGSTVTSGNIRYAASRMNLQITYGKELNKSEGSIRQYLQKTVKGDPAFIVSDKARWTINGMLGGYARKIAKDGSLNDNPIVNEYQILISAIESWVASLDLNDAVAYNSKMNWATAPNGQQYLTSRPRNK